MLEAEERWPNLCQFLGCHLHQDWRINGATPEQAVDSAVADWDLKGRQQVLREWRDWNDTRGWQTDVAASVNDGLGVEVRFATEVEARHFMNMIYEKLIVSVRAETEEKWTP
jgi:hypothetical protein